MLRLFVNNAREEAHFTRDARLRLTGRGACQHQHKPQGQSADHPDERADDPAIPSSGDRANCGANYQRRPEEEEQVFNVLANLRHVSPQISVDR
jgi:hypothetical protein